MPPFTNISTLVLLLSLRAAAQTTNDPVNSFLSAAFSVYTEVTSILASDASNTASSTSSSSTSSSSSSSTTSSSSSTLATSTSATPSKTVLSQASATAATPSASAAAHSKGGLSGTSLAIVLGCVLGALVLGLLALFLVICCKRRHRSKSGSPRLLSPDGDEIESWRNHSNRPRSRDGLIGGNNHHEYRNENTGVPNMAEHPAFANNRTEQNPFVPVPPAPRRSAPNSRAGLTDGTVPGQEPFLSKTDERHRNHHGGELAMGAGGAALGAAALHHHEKNKHLDGRMNNAAHDEKLGFARQAYPSTTTNDDVYAMNKFPSRPYNGDDYGYGRGPYEAGARGLHQPGMDDNAGTYRRRSSDHHSHALMAAGAGALGGAALANHHHQRNRSSSAPRRSYDSAKTPGPNALNEHVHPPMPLQDHRASNGTAAHDLVSPISTSGSHNSYSSVNGAAGFLSNPRNSHNSRSNTLSGSTANTNAHHIPSEMPGDVPTPPLVSPRRDSGSALNPAPPAAAALAHRGESVQQQRVPARSPARLSTGGPAATATRAGDRDSSGPSSASEDSAWRLSSGMPGGWGRPGNTNGRRDSSPAANEAHLRNAGINPVGRGGGVNSNTSAPVTGRRLRLADLRREEEEAAQQQRYDEGGDAGVGRAM